MKEKLLITLMVLVCSIAVKAYAIYELTGINVNFTQDKATAQYTQGNYVTTNSTLLNGDTVETTQFVSDGTTGSVTIQDPEFSQSLNSLSQSNAVNMDAITGTLMGVTGVVIASPAQSFDVTTNSMVTLPKLNNSIKR